MSHGATVGLAGPRAHDLDWSMPTSPRRSPALASDAHDGAGSTVSRRTLAKGAAWAAPVILATSTAPVVAASPCGSYKKGQPLPASAFSVTYLNVISEGLGDAISGKQVGLIFGFRVSGEAKRCGVISGTISSANNSGLSRGQINDPTGTIYNMTNDTSISAGGSVGVANGSCQSGFNGTEACGDARFSRYDLTDSQNTKRYQVSRISLYRSVTVSGYGTSTIYLNATIPTSGSFPHVGTNFSVTSRPAF